MWPWRALGTKMGTSKRWERLIPWVENQDSLPWSLPFVSGADRLIRDMMEGLVDRCTYQNICTRYHSRSRIIFKSTWKPSCP